MESTIVIIIIFYGGVLLTQPTLHPEMVEVTMTTLHLYFNAVDVFALDAQNNANKVGLSHIRHLGTTL